MQKESILKNYTYNMIYKILQIISPVITTPYISRVLGLSNIGIYNYALSIVSYFILISTLGMNMYGQREIASLRDDHYKRNILFSEMMLLKIFMTILSLTLFFITLIMDIFGYRKYLALLSIEIIANGIDASWVYYGLEKFKAITLRNISVKIIGIALIFLCVKSPDDLSIYIIVQAGTLIVGNLIPWIYLRKYIQLVRINFVHTISKHMLPVIIIFLPQAIDSIYMYMDKSMLGWLSDVKQVGLYSQADKIIKLVVTVITSMGLVISPKFVRYYTEKNEKYLRYYLNKSIEFVVLLSFPMMLGIVISAKNLAGWFLGNEYLLSGQVMIYMSPVIFFMGMNSVLGWQYLLSIKKEKLFMMAVFCGAVSNIFFNYLFIPLYGALGAALATCISMLLMTLINLNSVRNMVNYRQVLKYALKPILASLIMYLSLQIFLMFYNISGVICTILEVLVGIIVYGVGLLLLHDENILGFLRRIKTNYR